MPDLLSSLPSRPAAEKLLTRFFDNEEGPAPTFRKSMSEVLLVPYPEFVHRYSAQANVYEAIP